MLEQKAQTDKKIVLLTGGSGSIGIHFIDHFMINTNWDIVVLDSFQHRGYRDRINKTLANHPDWEERIRIVEHNLTCPISPQLKTEIGPVNHIVHLAAMTDVFHSCENPVWTIMNNIESTLVMLEYARNTEHDSFMYFSTDEVYGAVEKGGAHREWDAHRPSNAYSASKAASEDICYTYWRSGWVKLIVTNTMNNFGEMQSATKFPVIVQKALENGEEITIHGNENEVGSRFYIHSRNVADAVLYILQREPHLHEIGNIDDPDRYHIVGDECLSNLEMAQSIAKLMGKELKYKMQDFHKDNPAHDIHYGLQNNNLKAIGWKQPMSFDDSMARTIKWQTENPEWIN
jgi:dTDP-D-glucose 4,6-dehydratase